MTADPAYDVSTRDGYLRRVADVTDRRIPPRYRHAAPTEAAVMDWCDRFADGETGSLLILGATGVGKTWQAYGALRELAARGVTADWLAITAPDLYATLRPRDGADSETEFHRYADVPLLLLDDLGAAKASEWTEEITYRLIGHRYDAILPCLITSNVPTDKLRAELGDRVASRLAEMCQRVVLRGGDRRRTT